MSPITLYFYFDEKPIKILLLFLTHSSTTLYLPLGPKRGTADAIIL